MNPNEGSLTREALGLLRPSVVIGQIAIAAIVFVLCVVWLRLPDASAVEVACSVLLAICIILVATAGETALFLRVLREAPSRRLLLRGALLLTVAGALAVAACLLITHFEGRNGLRAGYLNSRFSPRLRAVFTYEHILLWLGWLGTALTWACSGLLAAIAFALLAAKAPGRAVRLTLGSVAFWVVVLAASVGCVALSGALAGWTPGHGVKREMLSLVLRLSVTVLVDAVVVCFFLAVIAVCVRRSATP